VAVVSIISLLVAVAGVAFGVFQWTRQGGRVRVQVDEGQADLCLRVVVDAPTPVHMNGIVYQLNERWLHLSPKGPRPNRRIENARVDLQAFL
jgi:hypothetical protein